MVLEDDFVVNDFTDDDFQPEGVRANVPDTALNGEHRRTSTYVLSPAERDVITIPSQDINLSLRSKTQLFPIAADDTAGDDDIVSLPGSSDTSSEPPAQERQSCDRDAALNVDDVEFESDIEIEDEIEDDFEGVEALFQESAAPSDHTVATLTPEDANLDPVTIALKYAFGLRAFRGEQQVRLAIENLALMERLQIVMAGSECAGDRIYIAPGQGSAGVDAHRRRQEPVLSAASRSEQWRNRRHNPSHLPDV